MAALYANEQFPLSAVESLRSHGHDVLTVQESGRANLALADEEVLAFASANGRAVITFNRRDFIRLHQLNANHAGIIVCKFDVDFPALAERIHLLIRDLGNLRGQLIRVSL